MNHPADGCPRCLIENQACVEHCDPATCDDPMHNRHVQSWGGDAPDWTLS